MQIVLCSWRAGAERQAPEIFGVFSAGCFGRGKADERFAWLDIQKSHVVSWNTNLNNPLCAVRACAVGLAIFGASGPSKAGVRLLQLLRSRSRENGMTRE